jgi:hypothetical protein
MRLIANTEMSCPAGDQACFCSRSNWAYGVRDCARQACDADQASQAINYAQNLCQGKFLFTTVKQLLLTPTQVSLPLSHPAPVPTPLRLSAS